MAQLNCKRHPVRNLQPLVKAAAAKVVAQGHFTILARARANWPAKALAETATALVPIAKSGSVTPR